MTPTAPPFSRPWRVILPMVAAILVAFTLDARVIALVNHYGPLDNKTVATVLRAAGQFYPWAIIAVLLGFFHRHKLLAAGLMLLTVAWAGLIPFLCKWIFGRHRPRISQGTLDFHPFINGLEGLFFTPKNLSFPSGDATLAFAGAICLGYLLPRWRWVFFVIAIFTGLERIAENDHHLSEVVAAGLAAYFAVKLAFFSGRLILAPRQIIGAWLFFNGLRLLQAAGLTGPQSHTVSRAKQISLGLLGIGLEGLSGFIVPKKTSQGHKAGLSPAAVAWGMAFGWPTGDDAKVLGMMIPPPQRISAGHDASGSSHRAQTIDTDVAGPELSPALSESMTDTQPYLSLVIPAYNEQESVPTLLQRVEASLNQLGRPYELLIIDDGSTDKTPQLLAEARPKLPWLRVLRMVKNAGQSAAFEAGFAAAKGELIATIDADLQNDPEEIPRLVKMLEENKVDMITGWRKDRKDTTFRRWQSRQANRIRNWITQETVNDSASSLKVYRAKAIQGIKLFRGAHRYFPTLVKMRGGTVLETPVKHSPRFAGTAKYGFGNRAFVGIADLFGVRWMKSRYIRYEAREVPPQG